MGLRYFALVVGLILTACGATDRASRPHDSAARWREVSPGPPAPAPAATAPSPSQSTASRSLARRAKKGDSSDDFSAAEIELGVIQGLPAALLVGAIAAEGTRSEGGAFLGALAGEALYGMLVLGLTDDNISVAHVQAINSGMPWLLANGTALFTAAFEQESEGLAVVGGVIAALSPVAGPLLANRLAEAFDPSSGAVALANSFGMWSGGLAIAGSLARKGNFDDAPVLQAIVIADLGFVFGALLSRELNLSRGQVWLIDLFGALGTGVAAAVVADGDNDREATTISIGMVAGLGLGAAIALLHADANVHVPAVTVRPSLTSDHLGLVFVRQF